VSCRVWVRPRVVVPIIKDLRFSLDFRKIEDSFGFGWPRDKKTKTKRGPAHESSSQFLGDGCEGGRGGERDGGGGRESLEGDDGGSSKP